MKIGNALKKVVEKELEENLESFINGNVKSSVEAIVSQLRCGDVEPMHLVLTVEDFEVFDRQRLLAAVFARLV